MALSGSTSKKYTTKGAYWVWVEWTATQNIANNTTTITAITYAGTNGYGYYTGSNNGSDTTVDGQTTSVGDSGDIGYNTVKRELCRRTQVVEHNSDGTKTVTISGRWWYGTTFDLTSSGTFTLDTIARASVPTLSVSSQALGGAITIYTNKKSTAFTHRIYSDFYDGFWTRIDSNGVVDSFVWTLPSSFASKLPNSTSGNGRIAVETYNGTTLVGTNIVNFTATIPDTSAYQPIIGGLSAVISGTGRDKTINKYVQGISKALVSFTSSDNGGATISSNVINIKRQSDNGNEMTYSGKSATSGVLTLAGTYLITVTTTDSRGRSKSLTTTITVDAYSVPKISSFTANRQSASKVSVDTVRSGSYTYLGGNNPLTVVISKRPRGGSYSNINTSSGDSSGKFSGTYVSKYTLNVDTDNEETISYDFKLTITDSFGKTATAEITVPTSTVAFSINKDLGIGAGKVHERGVLDVGGDAYFKDVVIFDAGSAIRQVNMGSLYTGLSSNVGPIIIEIGTSNKMFNAKINIRSYSYLANIQIGGYTYTGTSDWHSTHATGQISGGNLNVRFCTESETIGSKRYVVIGDTGTNWGGYLHVTVDDVTVGYGRAFTDPFIITLGSAYPARINNTINVGNASVSWDSVSGKPSTFPPSSHSHDYVPTARKVNGKALTADISLTAGDVGAATSSHSHAYLPTSQIANGTTGTITSSTWVYVSYGKTFSSVPSVVATGVDNVAGESFAKVRNRSTTGFEMVVGGTGTSNAFNWIAVVV